MADLAGKDYLTRDEAAHYACLSVRQWDYVRREWNIPQIPWGGKLVYRRTDIARAIEKAAQECRASRNATTRGISGGMRMGGSTASRSARAQPRKPNHTEKPKSGSLPEPA